jgi:hypothetical protein
VRRAAPAAPLLLLLWGRWAAALLRSGSWAMLLLFCS